METIEIELPNKRSIIVMLEMLGKYRVGKLGNVLNYKSIALGGPFDCFTVKGILHYWHMYINNAKCFGEKDRNLVEDFLFLFLFGLLI